MNSTLKAIDIRGSSSNLWPDSPPTQQKAEVIRAISVEDILYLLHAELIEPPRSKKPR